MDIHNFNLTLSIFVENIEKNAFDLKEILTFLKINSPFFKEDFEKLFNFIKKNDITLVQFKGQLKVILNTLARKIEAEIKIAPNNEENETLNKILILIGSLVEKNSN